MIEYILALAPLLSMHEDSPRLIAPHTTLSGCMADAEKRNRTDETLRTVEARVAGLEYVCLEVKRWRV